MRREGEENSDFQEGKENIVVSQTWALSQFTLLNYAFGDYCFHGELLLGFDI